MKLLVVAAVIACLLLAGCRQTANETCVDHGGVKQIDDDVVLCHDGYTKRFTTD